MTIKNSYTAEPLPQTTICAIATAEGGALGIIRVSGPEAIAAVNHFFVHPSKPNVLLQAKGQTLHFGNIQVGEEIIDEVLVSVFRAPHSYTGENLAEISCHGSHYIMQRILTLLVTQGCTLAAPGEFTQRAFINGKMDLSQAEAVADLIAAKNQAMHRMAINQMRGGYSEELKALRDKLLHLTSLLELELDFSDHEDLEFADRTELQTLMHNIIQVAQRLTDSFMLGNAFKRGIPTVIVGETNAGKSTLLNTLLHENKAIVSDIHGTTRDVIEDTLNIGNTSFRLIDTAGIRDTQDTIETIGIERSLQKVQEASIIVWLVDATSNQKPNKRLADEIKALIGEKAVIIVFNKCDLLTTAKTPYLAPYFAQYDTPKLCLSAKYDQQLSKLKELLQQVANLPEHIDTNAIIVSNTRHYEALTQAVQDLTNAQMALDNQLSGELIAMDLRSAINSLSDIIGEISSQDTLSNIFQHFCIGK